MALEGKGNMPVIRSAVCTLSWDVEVGRRAVLGCVYFRHSLSHWSLNSPDRYQPCHFAAGRTLGTFDALDTEGFYFWGAFYRQAFHGNNHWQLVESKGFGHRNDMKVELLDTAGIRFQFQNVIQRLAPVRIRKVVHQGKKRDLH